MAAHEGTTPEAAQCGLPADKAIGNPYDSPYVADLLAPRKSRNQLAAGHPDLRQSTPGATHALGRLRTYNGDTEGRGFESQDDLRGASFSYPGQVGLRLFDAAGQAGAKGPLHPTANPARPDYHQHRDSATPPNGTHTDDDPRSNAVPTGAPSNVSSSPRAAANGQDAHPVRGLSNNFAYGDHNPQLADRSGCNDEAQSQAVANKNAFLEAIREQARQAMR